MDALGIIVLAGGTAQRLGGVSKGELPFAGIRFVDWILHDCASLFPDADCVVVAPDSVSLPAGVFQVLEDPPFGGPVAGIGAGVRTLLSLSTLPEWMAVTTCDAPLSGRALGILWDHARSLDDTVDGVVAQIQGRAQPLLGIYRSSSLARAVLAQGQIRRDVAVKRVMGALELAAVPVSAIFRDTDTWEEIRRLETEYNAVGG